MGWGEPAAFNHVVHSSMPSRHRHDPGDVFYIRSTDSGVTFSAPFKLNTDPLPGLSGSLTFRSARAGTSWPHGMTRARAPVAPAVTQASPATGCIRASPTITALTWLPDDALSDVVSPLPAQPDPGIQATYAGDYDYGSALLTKHVTSWVDGRIAISGASQQDAFTDRELVGFAVTTTDPACNSIITTQPVDFIINLTDPVNPALSRRAISR